MLGISPPKIIAMGFSPQPLYGEAQFSAERRCSGSRPAEACHMIWIHSVSFEFAMRQKCFWVIIPQLGVSIISQVYRVHPKIEHPLKSLKSCSFRTLGFDGTRHVRTSPFRWFAGGLGIERIPIGSASRFQRYHEVSWGVHSVSSRLVVSNRPPRSRFCSRTHERSRRTSHPS